MTQDHSSPPSILNNAVTVLPKGKLATLVTYLALDPVMRPQRAVQSRSLAFERITGRDSRRYLEVFRRVGQPWLWFSRLLMPLGQLVDTLDHPDNFAYIVRSDGRDVGLCEVDCRNPLEAELAYLGLEPTVCGKGFGLVMMHHAIDCVLARGIGRMIVHTCQLDDPRAPGFYRSCGFETYQLAVEVMDDPRALGLYPLDSAPQIPMI